MKTLVIIFAVVGVVIIGMWFITRGSMNTITGQLLGGNEFAAALAAHPGATVIDVRTPSEFASGHMKGARNIDVQSASFGSVIANLNPIDTYFVYCHSGRRSAVATSQMRQKGISHIYELAGGALAAPHLMTER